MTSQPPLLSRKSNVVCENIRNVSVGKRSQARHRISERDLGTGYRSGISEWDPEAGCWSRISKQDVGVGSWSGF